MIVRVKICGLTTIEAALAAVDAGADSIGFVFTSSKREMTPENAKRIIQLLPPYVTTTGVFVNEELHIVNDIAAYCHLDLVQLHGQESPQYCEQVIRPVVKTISIRSEDDLSQIDAYTHENNVRAILLDTHVDGATGGTGQPFPWKFAVGASEKRAIILAGGLHVGNVARAIEQVRPYAVDVSSGVETEGVKDRYKMRKFVQEVHSANLEAHLVSD
ncbi:phosphoribosylanthranilate isomerase [Paenibacillus agilis]|uniref:phosphoribosylanthranilate isomerase n=1 Tax=Paenibacillus agilis TaxID=3020863 RepID=UPI001C97EDEC|nr:phosphoribosylanthranilate isomerase [Paenibacillus agilis]